MNGPLHVVQVGTDTSVFSARPASDTLERQSAYAAALTRIIPGSHMTYLVLGAAAQQAVTENLTLRGVPGGRVVSLMRLRHALESLHRERSIDVIATQSPFEETAVAVQFGRGAEVPIIAQVHFDLFSRHAIGVDPVHRAINTLRRKLALGRFAELAGLRAVGTGVAAGLRARPDMPPVRWIPVPMMRLADQQSANVAPREGVLFVGRIAPEKALERWIQVAALVLAERPETRFLIVGDGPDRPALQRKAASLLGSSVIWRGRMASRDLPEVYRSARVLLMTSLHEGFGRVAAEALGCATPVVATNVGGLSDIVIDGRSGFLHEADDSLGLARSVLRLLEDPALGDAMGAAGRADVVERFAIDHLVEDWIEMLIAAAQGRLQP